MVRLHPACLRNRAPARRLVSGRNDGIRNHFLHVGIAPATSTGFGTHFRRRAQRCAGCRLQGGARLRAKPTAVDVVTTRQPGPRRARGRTALGTTVEGPLARVMQYGLRVVPGPGAARASRTRSQRRCRVVLVAGGDTRFWLHRAQQKCGPLRVPGADVAKPISGICVSCDRG